MKSVFTIGDQKIFKRVVTSNDVAAFHGETVHEVLATFALGRDFEWASRLFFIELKEDDEEGVGTFLSIEHRGPAFVGEEVIFTATIEKLEGMVLTCSIEARVNDRLVAAGKTGQKMLKKEQLKKIFTKR
jgi:predicted thioesterase